jgi:hypothetical protein
LRGIETWDEGLLKGRTSKKNKENKILVNQHYCKLKYGSESWTLDRGAEWRIGMAEKTFLRLLFGVTTTDHVRNETWRREYEP